MTNKLVVISGVSGAGKGTVINELLKLSNDLKLVVSCTTRPKRHYEVEGREYYFTTENDFLEKIKERYFLEWEKIHETIYFGTPHSSIEEILINGKIPVLELDVSGAISIKNLYPNAKLVFITVSSLETAKERILKRAKISEVELESRIRSMEKELSFLNKYDLLVYNDDGKARECAEEILSFLDS